MDLDEGLALTNMRLALQPGSRSYARSWISDGALSGEALLRMGRGDVARDFADWYAELFADEQVVRIMLVTDGSTMVERMRRRKGPFDEELMAIGAETLGEYVATLPRVGWTVIDNTNSTLDDTVSEVLERFRS